MTRFQARLEPFGRPPSRRDWLRLGIPPDAHYDDLTARPARVVAGTPVTKLFS